MLTVWDLNTVLLWPIKQLRDLRGKSGLFRDHIWTLVPIGTKSRNRDLSASTAFEPLAQCFNPGAQNYYTTKKMTSSVYTLQQNMSWVELSVFEKLAWNWCKTFRDNNSLDFLLGTSTLLGQQHCLDVGQDPTLSDGDTSQEFVQLFIVPKWCHEN